MNDLDSDSLYVYPRLMAMRVSNHSTTYRCGLCGAVLITTGEVDRQTLIPPFHVAARELITHLRSCLAVTGGS